MKYGIRKPNIKKSISAKTTGKLKRKIKKTFNPLYGKKGMGIINDPQKAIYNKIYNKTTISAKDILKPNSSASTKNTFGIIGTFFQFFLSLFKIIFYLIIIIGIIFFVIKLI